MAVEGRKRRVMVGMENGLCSSFLGDGYLVL